jgi:hypothetical protein
MFAVYDALAEQGALAACIRAFNEWHVKLQVIEQQHREGKCGAGERKRHNGPWPTREK